MDYDHLLVIFVSDIIQISNGKLSMGNMRFILGRAGTGKRTYCLDLIARELNASPLSGPAAVLLVPEQATFQMSRALAGWQDLHGFIRAKVLSFKRLAHLAVSETTEASRPLLGISRKLLMQQILAGLKDHLHFWNNTPPDRIAESILSLMDELQQARLGPEELQSLNERIQTDQSVPLALKDKLQDLVRLSSEYQRIGEIGLDDPGTYLAKYRDLISKIDWLQNSLLVVNGFSGFTGQEYAALLATMAVAKETYISLTLDPDQLGNETLSDEDKMFGPAEQTYFRLLELANSTGIKVDQPIILRHDETKRTHASKTLVTLERYLTAGTRSTPADRLKIERDQLDPTLMVVSADNPSHEIDLAAGKIFQLVREKGMQYRQISVILRQLNGYEHLLRYVFDHYHIPYFLDIRRSVAQHPLTRLIMSAIGAVANNYALDDMLRYLKTGLAPAQELVCDRIENYILAHRIEGQRWDKEWKYRIEGMRDIDEAEEKSTRLFDLNALNRSRIELIKPFKRLEKFWQIDHETKQEFSIEVLLEGIVEMIKELDVPASLTKMAQKDTADQTQQIHQQILNVVMEIFDQLRITLGGKMITLEEFLSTLTQCFAESTVGVIPSNVDQVLIGTIDRTRHPAVRASLILGFNESVWPATPVDDVVLTDQDREELAWPDLAVKGDIDQHFLKEQYLAYIAMTRPSEFLWISHCRKDTGGNTLSPSRYLRQLEDFTGLGKSLTRVVPADDPALLLDSKTPLPITAQRISSIALTQIGPDGFDSLNGHGPFWTGLAASLNHKPQTTEIVRQYVEGFCDGNSAEIEPGLASKIYRSQISFSQLESFHRCPFQHFCKYGLRLEIPQRFELEPMDLGSLRHNVMKLAWQQVINLGESWRQIDQNKIASIVNTAVEQAASEIKDEQLFQYARNQYILQQTEMELTLALIEQIRSIGPSKFSPSRFEIPFEIDMVVNKKQYQLIGRIDRLDMASMGDRLWIMVVDYKSGVTSFKLTDWRAGTQLQLPGYLMVATTSNENSTPGGGVYLSLRPKWPSNGGSEEISSKLFPAAGLINVDELDLLIDSQNSTYPYGIKLKSDGTPYARSSVIIVNAQTVDNILKKTRTMVDEAVKAMASGNISIHPFYDGAKSVCPMCEMGGICRFNVRHNRYRSLSKLTKEEILAQLSES
jgi:ATP-dependent helicase/nuclease subunit B